MIEGETVHGVPGCPGIAKGIARVVTDSHDPTALAPGDILVAPITDPSWTPLFVPAAGVVVDVGAPAQPRDHRQPRNSAFPVWCPPPTPRNGSPTGPWWR